MKREKTWPNPRENVMASEEVRDIVENEEKKVETSYPNNYTHTSKGPTMNDVCKIPYRHATYHLCYYHMHMVPRADVIYGLSPQYTLLTFVPMNLLEQFRRVANSYFLLTFLLTLALPDSPVSPMSWVWSLLSVVLVTMGKQGYEDLLRHKSDRS